MSLPNRLRALSASLVGASLIVAGPMIDPSPASAAPSQTVTITSPAEGSSQDANPVLGWASAGDGLRYRVQVGTNPTFTSGVLSNTLTTNTRSTPTTDLPVGTIYWRVAAVDAGGAAGAYTGASFQRVFSTAPSPVSPSDLATLSYPQDAPVLTWQALPGAKTYKVEVDDADNFVGAATATTKNTSWAMTNPTTPNATYYWRVRGVSPAGANSDWSPTMRFTTQWGEVPVPQLPAYGATIEEITLQWSAVAGADRYKVEVDNDIDFTSKFVDYTVTTTRFNAGIGFPAGGFYWRVAAIDAGNNQGPWAPVQQFTKAWPVTTGSFDAISLTAPTNGANVTGPPTLSWTPQRLATYYSIEISEDAAFSPGTIDTCATVHTTFTPYNMSSGGGAPYAASTPGSCAIDPSPRGTNNVSNYWVDSHTYHWRVRAIDKASNGEVAGIYSAARSFTYHAPAAPSGTPPAVAPTGSYTTPTHCAVLTSCGVETSTPTFTWAQAPDAAGYFVYVATDSDFTNVIRVYSTETTQVTPRESLPDTQTNAALHWFVRPCDVITLPAHCSDMQNSLANARAFRKQSPPVQLISPADGATVGDQLVLDWQDWLESNQLAAPAAAIEARTYKVQLSLNGNFTTIFKDSGEVQPTEWTFPTESLPEGPIYWRVQVVDGSGQALGVSPTRVLTKSSAAPVPVGPLTGQVVAGVPTFDWVGRAYGGRYDVEVYKHGDLNFSSVNRVANGQVKVAGFTTTNALPAGSYAWRVRQVDAGSNPKPWSVGQVFTLQPEKPQLVSPTHGAHLRTDELLFQWTAVSGAVSYRFESSTTAAFTSTIEAKTTAMTSWAPEVRYPDTPTYWRVKVLDADGNELRTSDTGVFTKDTSSLGELFPLTPARILDTRAAGGPLGANGSRELTVTGQGGVPTTGVAAVVLNVTVSAPTRAGYLTVYPTGGSRPEASNLNFVPGQDVPNLVVARVGNGGKVTFYNAQGETQVIADVVGYYSDGSTGSGARFNGLAPARIWDTRSGPGPTGKLAPGETRTVTVTGAGGVPASGVSAVVVNVTVTDPTSSGYLTVWPAGENQPTASNLNFVPGLTVPNLVYARVGAGGALSVYNSSGDTHVLFDVVGWFSSGTPTGDRFNSLTPSRTFDSRSTQALGPGESRDVVVTGLAGVPASGVTSVAMNVTVTQTTGTGYLTVFPTGTERPNASNLNFVPGQDVPNSVVAKVGEGGRVTVYNSSGTSHVIFDVVGWYAA